MEVVVKAKDQLWSQCVVRSFLATVKTRCNMVDEQDWQPVVSHSQVVKSKLFSFSSDCKLMKNIVMNNRCNGCQ